MQTKLPKSTPEDCDMHEEDSPREATPRHGQKNFIKKLHYLTHPDQNCTWSVDVASKPRKTISSICRGISRDARYEDLIPIALTIEHIVLDINAIESHVPILITSSWSATRSAILKND